MIKVECPGCKAPYQVDERRVPDAGLKMRCPKCATSFVVSKPGAAGAESKAKPVQPPPAAAPKPAPAAPKPAPRAADAAGEMEWDLPAPAAARPAPGTPPAKRQSPGAASDQEEDVDLPVVAPPVDPLRAIRAQAKTRPDVPGPAAPRPAPAPAPAPAAAGGRGFGEIDLVVDLPAPEGADESEIDLPIARAKQHGAGLPARQAAPAAAPPAPRPAARAPTAPASPSAKGAPPGAVRARTQLFGDTVPDPSAAPSAPPAAAPAPIKVPVPAREAKPAAKPAPAPPPAPSKPVPSAPLPFEDALGFGEIDLPLLASDTDLPATSATGSTNLPSPAAGLPAPANAALPSPVEGNALPVRSSGAGLPMAAQGTTLPVATQGTTLPVRGQQRTNTPAGERISSSDFSSIDIDEPRVHGPGQIAGADIYSGAVYDDRNLDAAFGPAARNLGSKANEPEEAPFVTTSGRNVRGATAPNVSPARGATAPNVSSSREPTRPEVPLRDPFASEPPPRDPFGSEPSIGRGSSGGASMADLIDRTSIELDLVEPTAPPAAPVGGAVRLPTGPTPSPQIAYAGGSDPLSVPDLSAELDMGGPPPPRAPRFDSDPLAEASQELFVGNHIGADLGSGPISSGYDAGTEVALGAIDDGEEADIDGKGSRGTGFGKAPQIVVGPAPATEAPPPKRPWKKYVVVLAVVGLFTGALLTLVPDIGPFGLNFVSDRVNKQLHNDSLDTARGIVQTDLEADTSAGADRAIGKIKTAQHAYPRHRPTAGYAAYIAYQRILRFGPRAEDKAFGDMMIRVSQDRQSDFLLLGQAAQDAVTGQIARARQTMQGLLDRRPDDIDVAVLAGEIELLAKSGDQATKVWQRAVNIKKVPRTLFGLARAQAAANDFIGAEASARNALDMSPKHVGARTLLAGIVWQNGGREQQALELLGKVTDDGEIRASAGEPELVAAYTQLGSIHLAKSRMSQAEQAFASALKIDPQAVNALVGNGELFYRSGRYSEAIARYEAAIRADADSVPAKIGMAKTQLFLERAKDSKDLLKKLCETRPNEPLAFYWLGRAEESLGNKKDAEIAYANAIKVGGDSPQIVDAYVALAQLLSSLGRINDANARLTEAGNRFPGLPALHRARGEVALSSGNYEEARKEFEAALAREDDLGTKFKLGVVLRLTRSFEDAGKIFDAIQETDKDFPGLALERGLVFEETGQSERASEMYAKALQAAPNDPDLKLRVGSTQVKAGHAKQAEPILREVHRAKPNSAEVNHYLGRALLVRGTSLAEAKRFLTRATEIDPNRAEYHLYVGWVANELGEAQLAESALKRAIELDRNLGDAYWQRGVLLQKQGQALDALADLKIAMEKSPSRYEIYATMAYCYQDQSRWPEAEEMWKKAIAGNGEVADWHYRLGKVYFTRGNRALATPELDKAVELAEAPDKATPGWLAEAHFLLGEAFRGTNKEKAKRHYNRFLELAPQSHPYRIDAQRALEGL